MGHEKIKKKNTQKTPTTANFLSPWDWGTVCLSSQPTVTPSALRVNLIVQPGKTVFTLDFIAYLDKVPFSYLILLSVWSNIHAPISPQLSNNPMWGLFSSLSLNLPGKWCWSWGLDFYAVGLWCASRTLQGNHLSVKDLFLTITIKSMARWTQAIVTESSVWIFNDTFN